MTATKTVLVVGSGGREHALAWALSRSPQVGQVFVAPGNAGTDWAANPDASGLQPRAASTSVPLGVHDTAALIAFAREHQVALTVVGPEAPLADGLVDAFQAEGLPVFGPTRAAAQLESSKVFAKQFMREHHIPTADFDVFDTFDEANEFVAARAYGTEQLCPVVIKADGLAAGKGVIVCSTLADAQQALTRIMIDREFGASGNRVLIEDRLSGREVSVLAFTDGRTIVTLPPSRDHKPVFDNDDGPNTGGMGAYTHPPDVDEALLARIEQTVLHPTVAGMAAQGIPYQGVLYAGLMLTPDGPMVLEFNCRFGDPEIEAIMLLLAGDIMEVLGACVKGRLKPGAVACHAGVGATVVAASPGYPGSYPKGLPISGLDTLAARDDVIVFHAGTARQGEQLVTAGGRVLAVSAPGDTLAAALQRVYDGISQIHFDGIHYRRDIGRNS